MARCVELGILWDCTRVGAGLRAGVGEEGMSAETDESRAGWEVEGAAEAMGRAKVGRLPVVDEAGKLVGSLSMNDIARSAAHDASMGRELVQTMASVCAAHPKHATAPTAKAVAAALASSQRS